MLAYSSHADRNPFIVCLLSVAHLILLYLFWRAEMEMLAEQIVKITVEPWQLVPDGPIMLDPVIEKPIHEMISQSFGGKLLLSVWRIHPAHPMPDFRKPVIGSRIEPCALRILPRRAHIQFEMELPVHLRKKRLWRRP